MPTFDGTGNLEQFKQLFSECCSINGWAEDTVKALWLKQCMRGRARDIVYDECSSLETLWERLRNRFGEHLLKQQYRRLLPNRKRQNGETLTQLVDDIRKMSDVVYCHNDGADNGRPIVAVDPTSEAGAIFASIAETIDVDLAPKRRYNAELKII